MEDDDVPCCEPKFWVYLTLCLVLLTFAFLTSGLSLGLFSYSQVDLEVLVKAGLPYQRKNAASILPLVKNQYLLLCTLLIAKSLALEALPIFLDRIIPFWAAILVSVTIVLSFAEVIPQAVCSRYGLSFSAKFVLFVRLLRLIMFPVAYPVSKILDWLLGKDSSAFLGRGQLRTLVDLLSVKAGRGGELTDDETTIITGALDMTEKTAKDAMTPISKTFSLDINAVLDMHTMGLIMSKGHSRVPFYSGNPKNIIGLVLVKNLIFCDPEEKVPLKNITLRRIPRVYDHWPLYDVLKLFQKGHSHMAVVVRSKEHGDDENKAKQTPQFIDVTIQSNSPLATRQVKGADSPFPQGGSFDISLSSSDQSNRWDEEVGNISTDELGALKDKYAAEEVIGIITMEDVMEELLQEEILDETDLNVLHKIRMNHLPWMRSTTSSPGWNAGSPIQWRTPATSGFSSYYNTPILHSPISSYSPPPLIRSVISSSPGKWNLGSPSGFQIRWKTPSSSFSSYNATPILQSPISPYVPSPHIRPTLQASPGKPILGSPSSGSWYSISPFSPSKQVPKKSYEKFKNVSGIS